MIGIYQLAYPTKITHRMGLRSFGNVFGSSITNTFTMKQFGYYCLILALTMTSCSSQQGARKKNTEQISMISLSKTPCFGTCPAYTIEIDKNCIVKLDAVAHVPNDMKGKYKTNLPEKEWMLIVDKLESMQFKDLQDQYGNRQITDLPSVNTMITFAGGETKKINDYGARGTEELSVLYTYADSLVRALDWEPVSSN